MAKMKTMIFDKTELILTIAEKNSYVTMNLTSDKITRIEIQACTERKLFKKLPSQRIMLIVRGREEPVFVRKLREGELFEEYKRQLAVFAKNNRVTFVDNMSEGGVG